MTRRGEVAFTTIVGVVIALVVLVLIISFATGSLSELFKDTSDAQSQVSDVTIQAARNKCQTYCTEARGADSDTWSSTRYCSDQVLVDGQLFDCYAAPINIECKATFQDATSKALCNSTYCGTGGCQQL